MVPSTDEHADEQIDMEDKQTDSETKKIALVISTISFQH